MNNVCILIREIYISHSYYTVMAERPKIKTVYKKIKSADISTLFYH
ncbi:hypothetical protein P262_05355 [Cronobacter malonaticus]|uniref:Uncharacterized protein n=1 Tax=Cronobacter malonaticus TaxID=413503 RepID=V5U3S8_9ENTR|nr:hypothetical protein P262_05355 [Cronobacter malonaticus]CCJ95141.1 hypothetical protein BN131_2814 [Cronobacter malonaticus 681]